MLDVHEVRRALSVEQAAKLIGDDVPAMPATVTAPGLYVDAETSEPLLAYLPMPDEAFTARLRRAVLDLKMTTTPRASGMNNVSRTFGMAPRKPVMRREACVATTMAMEQPECHEVLVELADVFTVMLRSLLPEHEQADREYVEQVLPEWRMTDDALWTSGVVNRSSTLPYHLDRANFPTWSAMPVVRRHMRGGFLSMPEYDMTCACRDGYVLFMVGRQLVHGVTPMQPLKPDAYRYSIVYYALRGMKDCFTTAIEQRRGRTSRTAREATMVPDTFDHTAEDG